MVRGVSPRNHYSVWNHRSSAPPGPLPKNEETKKERKKVKKKGRNKERKKERKKKKKKGEKDRKHKRNSRKSVTWSAVPDAPKLVYVGMRLRGAAAPEEPMTYDST